MSREDTIIESIEEDLRLQREAGKLSQQNLGKEWARRMLTEPGRFIENEIRLKQEALRDFRKDQIFVGDLPVGRRGIFNLFNFMDGARRGHAKMLKESLGVLEEAGFLDLLRKYPISHVGNPDIFCHKGCRFTFAWARHIYFLGLFRKYIAPRLKTDFTALDLGSNYGLFSSLLKSEFNGSHNILVDLPQQLSLAHYYLSLNFPEAKIATYKDLEKPDVIGKDMIKRYDFILVPCYFYDKIAKDAVDVFTNFMSLQEMSREFFDYYLTRGPFLSAPFFFTVNRYQSAPTYDNGLTILDYPLGDFERIHFATTPIVGQRYKRKMLFFYTYFPYASQHFEFIGKRA